MMHKTQGNRTRSNITPKYMLNELTNQARRVDGRSLRFQKDLIKVDNNPSRPGYKMQDNGLNKKALMLGVLLLCSMFPVEGGPLHTRRVNAETGNMTVPGANTGLAYAGGSDAFEAAVVTSQDISPLYNRESERHNTSGNADEISGSGVELNNEDWGLFDIVKSIGDSFLEIFNNIWNVIDMEDRTDKNAKEKFLSYLEKITESVDKSEGRLDAIDAILREMGFQNEIKSVPYHSEFSYWAGGSSDGTPDQKVTVTTEGVNLVVDVAPPEPGKFTLAFTAHYDRVDEGKGAIDNASGCAAVIAILEEFQKNPLDHFNVKGIFFGAEEDGLVGSTHFLKQCNTQDDCPTLLINIDVLGFKEGNTLTASGVETAHNYYVLDEPRSPDGKEQTFIKILSGVAETQGLHVYGGGVAAQSDHLPFQRAGWSAIGLSLTGNGDPAELEKYQEMNYRAWNLPEPPVDKDPAINEENYKEYYAKVDSAFADATEQLGHIGLLKEIHTKEDTFRKVNAGQAIKGVDVIVGTVREMDKKFPLQGWA